VNGNTEFVHIVVRHDAQCGGLSYLLVDRTTRRPNTVRAFRAPESKLEKHLFHEVN